MKLVTAAVAILLLVGSLDVTPRARAAEPMIFGVVPQQSASRLARDWVPILSWLSAEMGVEIQFATAKDIPTFESCLAKGAYDIAYMNPYHYIVFHEVSGYTAVAHAEGKRLKGIVVTRSDSSVMTLEDLDGTQVAFPSPAAFGASVLPRAEMAAKGIDATPVYVRSHDSVYRAVAAGLHPAGGGVLRTWRTIPDEIRAQLRILYETDAYTPHAVATLSSMAATQRTELSDALASMAKDAPELLVPLGKRGFRSAVDADWDDVRALGLDQGQTGVNSEDSGECHSG
jgi:phosphonate transport system substrate-binding protein